ncbi:MAG: sensor histidine kinase [Gaiellaceae bacterium]
MSLRARLIAGLLVIAAAGLIALAAITYAEQRSFLFDRADQQAHAALPIVSRSLDDAGANVPGSEPQGGGFGGPVGGGPGGGPRGGPGPPPHVDLPPGTFGQRRDATGNVLGNTVLSYALPRPKLPASMPVGKPITVGSSGSSGTRYRALAEPTGDQPGATIVAVPLRDVDQTLHRLLRVEALVIAGVLAILAAVVWWLVRLGLRPLDRMGETAGAIAAGDLSRRVTPATPRTEVGRLGLALNSLLAQIEKAFAERQASESRLRRFLADASHELRTPLTSIRGYAEVFRTGAARSPGEKEKAMSRIEDEAKRMGAMVEDLLTLARLDQLPEVARNPVDLARLAEDAAGDARAAAPERTISVVAPDGEAVVLGDASNLRQVLGNLTRNALVHTPAGTPVELTVARDGDHAAVTVRDHGPGLPAGDADALFERFWRSDPGRGRGPAGAGLGLSIVAAIVHAHGGSVHAENAPGDGASFSVRLAAAAHEKPATEPAATTTGT